MPIHDDDDFNFNNATIGPFPELETLIVVAFPLVRARHWPYLKMASLDEQRHLSTSWSNVLDIPIPNSESRFGNLIGLSWHPHKDQPLSPEMREQLRIPTLRSVSEPLMFPWLMQSPESSPHLKLANCVYDGIVKF